MAPLSGSREVIYDPELRPWDGLGRRVRQRRAELRLTQRELGAAMGTPQRTIYTIERGVSFPRVDTLWKLSEALGVNIHWLVTGELRWVSPQQTRNR